MVYFMSELTQYCICLVLHQGEHCALCVLASIDVQAIFGFRIQYSQDWSVAECYFEGVKSTLALSIPGEWSVLDHSRRSTWPSNVPFSIRSGANGVQPHCNISLGFNEFFSVAGDTQEASDILTIFMLRPIHYRT
jgi:hypothetical protein